MNDERLISILCAQQWEKCKGELKALIALQGNKAIRNREWEQLSEHVNALISAVEDNELHY